MEYDLKTKVILNTIGERVPDETSELINSLTENDWYDIIENTDKHSITPLFYYNLKKRNLESSLPESIVEKLRERYLAAASRNLQNYYGVKKIVKKLQSENIPVIILKGVHLADEVYGNIALRFFCDLDILVKKPDLHKVCKQFEEMGYQASKPFLIKDIIQSNFNKHLPAFRKQKALPVEIHWALEPLAYPFNIDTENLWKRTQKISILKTDALGLCPEDLILNICIHAAYDHFFDFGLKPLCDIVKIVKHYNETINWKKLVLRAKEWRAERCLYLTFIMAHELLKLELPEEIEQILQKEQLDQSFIENAIKKILKIEKISNHNIFLHLAIAFGSKGFLQKFRKLMGKFFPSGKIMTDKYPVYPNSLKRYLYYPVRWLDLLKDYGLTAVKLVFRNKSTQKQFNNLTELREWLKE